MWLWLITYDHSCRRQRANTQVVIANSSRTLSSSVVVSLILFFIALNDFRTHKVPNVSLVVLALSSLVSFDQQFHPIYILMNLLAVALFTIVSRCGFGDSKLAIIVLNLIIPPPQISSYLFNLTIASAFVVSAHVVRAQSFRGNIAFAPAICGAVLALTP